MKPIIRLLLVTSMVLTLFLAASPLRVEAAPRAELTPGDLISLINNMRVAYGLPALNIDPILMSTAQQTSDTMAINDIHWHIGNVSGRVMAAGYGGGAIAWATENFAIGTMTISEIQQVWADPDHMIPVVNANYRDIGAGVTTYNGRTWYIVHAAYSSGGSSVIQNTAIPGTSGTAVVPLVSQIIIPVETVEAQPDGSVIHEVQSGQALWSIAIAYNTKIEELIRLNQLVANDPIIYVGQKLIVFPAQISPTALTPTESSGTLTVTPSPTRSPTRTPTRRMTKTSTATIPLPTATTPAPAELIRAESAQIFGNRNIGVIIISALALGILLIVSGSLTRLKK